MIYTSNGTELKGLLKAAYYDPNPVVILEHKGLYWSKVQGTENAKCPEPGEDYVVPFGKARIFQQASEEMVESGESISVITYGMGVHWSLNASKNFRGRLRFLI